MTDIEFRLTADATGPQTQLGQDIAALDAWNAAHPAPTPATRDDAAPYTFAGTDADGLATYTTQPPAPEPTTIDTDALTAQGIHEIPTMAGAFSPERAFTTGRDAKGHFAGWHALTLYTTRRGHWYRSDDERDDLHNDTVCRGCGHHGHFPYILDYKPCPNPATTTDITSALHAS